MSKSYVVYMHEHLQDGHEYGARVVASIEEGLRYMTKIRQNTHINAHNLELRLFELGKEIEVVEQVEEEPQPSKKTVTYKEKPCG